MCLTTNTDAHPNPLPYGAREQAEIAAPSADYS